MRIFVPLISLAFAATLLSCKEGRNGSFFYGSLGLGSPRIAISTQNAGALTVLLYDLNGALIKVLADYTSTNDIPKGIAPFDSLSIAVLLDGADRIARASFLGQILPDVTANANLTGTLWQLAFDARNNRYLAVEGNTIEAFSTSGDRIGSPFINTTTGPCTLSVPRGLASTSEGRLSTVATGNDDLNTYDISGGTVTCLNANTTFGNIDPVAVLAHSNGLLYVATQGDDRVYSFAGDGTGAATVVWNTNLTHINNPTALLELPDGSILVASDLTNSIARINPDGTLFSATTFIRDAFSGSVTQMLLLDGE